MDADRATNLLLETLLDGLHPAVTGAVVEVGLGSSNYSFRWAAPNGFRCVAVEPLPVEALVSACEAHGVTLVRAAVDRSSGLTRIYHGELNGHGIPDTSSLRADWWAAGTAYSEVKSLSLADVFRACQVTQVACLKVDVEGAEWNVLSGLVDIPESGRPQVIAFEYGGGGRRDLKTGGWSEDVWQLTIASLGLLKELGYSWGILCERVLHGPLSFSLSDVIADPSSVFPEAAEVGNLIVCRGDRPEELMDWLWTCRMKESWSGIGDVLMMRATRPASFGCATPAP